MDPQSSEPDAALPLTRAESFEALARAVAGLRSAGRSTVSAAVKPALIAGTGYRFNEAALGYASFRDFLRAAQEARAVVVVPAASGTDVSVLPVDGDPGADAPRPRVAPVRADLWQAFVDWSPGWTRLWDRDRALALRFPERPDPSEDPANTQARSLWQAEPARFAAIAPVGIDTTLAWMAEFADALAVGAARDDLLGTLRGPKPLRAWTDAARKHALYDQWHERRLRHLRGAVLAWAARNDVDLSGVPVGGPSGPAAGPAAAAGAAVAARDADPVRQWLLDLIGRLPASELATIHVSARHAAQG